MVSENKHPMIPHRTIVYADILQTAVWPPKGSIIDINTNGLKLLAGLLYLAVVQCLLGKKVCNLDQLLYYSSQKEAELPNTMRLAQNTYDKTEGSNFS